MDRWLEHTHRAVATLGRRVRAVCAAATTASLLAASLAAPAMAAPLQDTQALVWTPFAWGQCTWYAAGRRPDLIPYVGTGDARSWDSTARARGRAVVSWPRVGSLVVFQPWVQGAYWEGHVGYVERVGANGWFLLSETNWNGSPSVHYRWAHAGWGVDFVL